MASPLAIDGGPPVRTSRLPYGRQTIDEDDIAAVAEVLRSDYLTTGPTVEAFEKAFASFTGAREAVAVANGTAALHAAVHAIGIGPGDEVIVPPITFAATANCVVFQGGTPVFADVDDDTLTLSTEAAARLVTARTRAIIAVDYAGHPCDYDGLRRLASDRGLRFVSDACHAVGAAWRGHPVGSLADLSTFSFHPVKNMTTGEGGAVTTDDPELARRMRLFRSHGITTDFRQRQTQDSWVYEMVELGYNYRLTDFQAALGLSQLRKLPGWIARRREIARRYDGAFAEMAGLRPLSVREGASHGYHLYMIRLDLGRLGASRAQVFAALRAEGIGVNVHYIPVHLHPFYRSRFGTGPGLCPVAEQAYEELVTLPIYPLMSDADTQSVVDAVEKVIAAYRIS